MKLTSLIFTAVLLVSSLTSAADKVNPFAPALGGIGAQAIFTTYMAITELAELFDAKAYSRKKAADLARTYVKMTEGAKQTLTDLINSGETGADGAAVHEMVKINDLLGKMANNLASFVSDPSDESESAYNESRQKAWGAISKFLGISE